jgi:uncharacterized SAM-binding protein YcdF (DUF218 family)
MSRKWKITVVLFVLFGIWVLLAPFFANLLIIEKPLEKADVIMVLSGASVFKERTHKAARIYKTGVARKILLTDDGELAGWSQKEERNPPFVYLAQQELIAQGVAAEDIEVLTPKVSGTIYEAEVLSEKLKSEKWRTVLIVTSAYHTKRSLWTFEKTLGNGYKIGIVSPPTGEDTPPPQIWWLSEKGWNYVAGEYVKSLGYWIYY